MKTVKVLDLSDTVEDITGVEPRRCYQLEINSVLGFSECENLAFGNGRSSRWTEFFRRFFRSPEDDSRPCTTGERIYMFKVQDIVPMNRNPGS